MEKKRKIKIAAKFVTFKEAEENDNIYFSKMSAEDLLKQCFEIHSIQIV